MANRSDFLGVLPRQLSRMIAMGVAAGYVSANGQARDMRKLFAAAHKTHKAFKLNRKPTPELKAALKSDAEADTKGQ